MTNFIFKSQGLIKNVANQLETILTEQRHQRSDLAQIIRMLQPLINSANLQRQVDDYFEDDKQDIPEKGDLD